MKGKILSILAALSLGLCVLSTQGCYDVEYPGGYGYGGGYPAYAYGPAYGWGHPWGYGYGWHHDDWGHGWGHGGGWGHEEHGGFARGGGGGWGHEGMVAAGTHSRTRATAAGTIAADRLLGIEFHVHDRVV